MHKHIRIALISIVFGLLWLRTGDAQVSARPDTPFKLATFAADGPERVGLLLDDRLLDLGRANAYVEQQAGLAPLAMPSDMKALIEASGTLMPRLFQIANYLDGKTQVLDFAYDPRAVSFKAPIKYPWNILAAGQNYRAHAAEMGGRTEIDPDVDDPLLFTKSPRSSIADPNEPYVIPPGRDRIDWEGEVAIVVGKTAKGLTLDNAMEHVFGFTILFDVSDRAAQIPENGRYERDWYAGKSMDGAAPMGPYLVPKEFLPNYGKLHLTTRVNGEVMQDSDTSYLIHDVEHLMRFATRPMTLWPGDVISTGTPEGVGQGRNPPVYLQRGDLVAIEVEGIGTLVTPMR